MTRVRLRDVPRGPVVYLIHLHAPLKHARHYVGWSSNLRGRMLRHRKGHGDSCCFMRAVYAAGIKWHVAKVWPGADRAYERKIKTDGNVARLCPVCRAKALKRNAANVARRRAAKLITLRPGWTPEDETRYQETAC